MDGTDDLWGDRLVTHTCDKSACMATRNELHNVTERLKEAQVRLSDLRVLRLAQVLEDLKELNDMMDKSLITVLSELSGLISATAESIARTNDYQVVGLMQDFAKLVTAYNLLDPHHTIDAMRVIDCAARRIWSAQE